MQKKHAPYAKVVGRPGTTILGPRIASGPGYTVGRCDARALFSKATTGLARLVRGRNWNACCCPGALRQSQASRYRLPRGFGGAESWRLAGCGGEIHGRDAPDAHNRART